MSNINATIQVKTISEANVSEHWTRRHQRSKLQKRQIKAYLEAFHHGQQVKLPCKVRITRVGKKRMDSDNLAISMKYIRDALAEWIVDREGQLATGKADETDKLTWIYDQEIGKNYEVKIQIEEI